MPPQPDDCAARLTPRVVHGRRCPAPVLILTVRTQTDDARRQPLRWRFVLDTGSDFALVPAHSARTARLVGYDPGAACTAFDTSLNGRFEGYWGTLTVHIGRREAPPLPCFYYLTDRRPGGWFDGFVRHVRRWRRGENAQPIYPVLLGRSTLFDHFNLGIEGGGVVLTRRPLLRPEIMPLV